MSRPWDWESAANNDEEKPYSRPWRHDPRLTPDPESVGDGPPIPAPGRAGQWPLSTINEEAFLPADVLRHEFVHGMPPAAARAMASTSRMLRGAWYRTVTELPRGALLRMRGCRDASLFPALQRLDLSEVEAPGFMTDDCVANFTDLRDLDLSQNPYVGDNGVRALTRLERLKLVMNSKITNAALEPLGRLRWLDLTINSVITNDGLRTLSSLRVLVLDSAKGVTDAAFTQMPHLAASLAVLSLKYNTVITDAGIRPLASLTTLILTDNESITNAGVAALTSLTSLNLSKNRLISNVGIRDLVQLKKLVLEGNSRRITDIGIARLTALTDLRAKNTLSFTGEALRMLTALTSLDLSGCKEFDDQALLYPPTAASLRVLRLNSRPTNVGNDALRQLTALTELHLAANARISVSGIETLSALRTLRMDDSAVQFYYDTGDMDHLFPLLRRLNIAGTRITDANLAEEPGKLRDLRVIDVRGCRHITAASLVHLTGLRRIVLDELTGKNAAADPTVPVGTFLRLPELVEVTATQPYFALPDVRLGLRQLRNAGIRVTILTEHRRTEDPWDGMPERSDLFAY